MDNPLPTESYWWLRGFRDALKITRAEHVDFHRFTDRLAIVAILAIAAAYAWAQWALEAQFHG